MIGAGELTDEMLARKLEQGGVIPAGAGRVPAPREDRPWFVTLVLGGAGWVAGLCVLTFVMVLFEPATAPGMALAGVVMLGAALVLYFGERENPFFAQLALAFSVAGQLAFLLAAVEANLSATATAGLTAMMQIALLLVVPNRFAKILAAFLLCIAWALTIRFAWWGESTFAGERGGAALLPAFVGWLLIWAPIAAAVHVAIAREAEWMARPTRSLIRPLSVGLLLGLALATWVSEPLASLRFWIRDEAYTDWLGLWPLLGAAAALFAAVSAFRLRDRVLVGTAIAGALLHVIQFYYLLGVSLLVKSTIMLAVGIAMLFAARILVGNSRATTESAP